MTSLPDDLAGNATANVTEAATSAAAAAPPDAGLAFHVVLGIVVVSIAVWASLALVVWSARAARLRGDSIDAAWRKSARAGLIFLVMPALMSCTWIYRWEIALAFLGVVHAFQYFGNWYFGNVPDGKGGWVPHFSGIERLELLAGAIAGLAEVIIVEGYYFGYRYLYREWHPDLAISDEGSHIVSRIGRLYKVEPYKLKVPAKDAPAKEETRYRVHFAKRGGGLMQWRRRLHVLDVAAQPPDAIKRTVTLTGCGIVRDPFDGKLWTLTNDPLESHPLHADSAQVIINRVLGDNAKITKDGSGGNPHYIAKRINDDPTSSASVDSWSVPVEEPSEKEEAAKS